MSKYWKADKSTSRKLAEIVSIWNDVICAGLDLSKEVGASDEKVVTADVGYGSRAIIGFIFDDESKVDRKQFVRLRNCENGWRPRRDKSELSRRFYDLRYNLFGAVCELIGLEMFTGLSLHTPGLAKSGDTYYVTTHDAPDRLNGCKRITDVQYEKIFSKEKVFGKKPKKASQS